MKKRMTTLMMACLVLAASHAEKQPVHQSSIAVSEDGNGSAAVVYFTKEITPESLTGSFEALDVSTEGRRVAIKISTGESN